jgi:uncharacterized RDD family membrane protein YckC
MTEFAPQRAPAPLPRDPLQDQLTIDTPEQVSLRFPVAGIGSRFLAVFADTLLQIGIYLALFLIFILVTASAPKSIAGEMTRSGEKWLVALVILIHFLMYWGYFTLFEALKNGQTPGKMIFKLRVIQDSGRQITFFEALVRNLIRVVDMIPSFYLIGVISMLCNRQHKRLGDLAAGTLVVHERQTEGPGWSSNSSRTFTSASFTPSPVETLLQSQLAPEISLPADAIARLSVEDMALIDRFFSRILDMDLATRASLAARLCSQMAARMQIEIPADFKPERVLEAIAHQRRAQGGGR